MAKNPKDQPMSMEERVYKLMQRVKALEKERDDWKVRCRSYEHDVERKEANIRCLQGGARPYKDRVMLLSRELDVTRQESELKDRKVVELNQEIGRQEAKIVELERKLRTLSNVKADPKVVLDADLAEQL